MWKKSGATYNFVVGYKAPKIALLLSPQHRLRFEFRALVKCHVLAQESVSPPGGGGGGRDTLLCKNVTLDKGSKLEP